MYATCEWCGRLAPRSGQSAVPGSDGWRVTRGKYGEQRLCVRYTRDGRRDRDAPSCLNVCLAERAIAGEVREEPVTFTTLEVDRAEVRWRVAARLGGGGR